VSPRLRQQYPNLPKYVTNSNGRIVYRPYLPPGERQGIDVDKHGFLRPPVKLGKVGDREEDLLRAYLAARATLDAQSNSAKHTLRWIINQYLASSKFKSLAHGTQKRVSAFEKILDHPVRVGGDRRALGDLRAASITMPMARRLADKRLTDYKAAGRKGEAQVNHEIGLLSAAVAWARQYLDNTGLEGNPFDLPKFKTPKNKRYVTDEEYLLQSRIAGEIAPYLPVVFELTYLLAARGIEVLDLKLSDATSDGIDVARRKGSRDNTILWSDRLRAAYQAARDLHQAHTVSLLDPPMIIGAGGRKLSKSGLDSAMQRLRRLMVERGLEDRYWNLHLLKAKGVSDAKDKRIAGHRSEAMRDQYNVKREKMEPAG